MDPTEIKSKEARGRVMFLQSSSVRVQRSRAGSESFRGHRWINPPRREECCHHLDESPVQHTVSEALAKPGLTKRATCHTFPASLCHVWAQPRASGRLQWARDVTFSRRSYADPRKKP